MGIIWFKWWSEQDHPFLVLILKRRYATLGLDMFSTNALTLSEGAFHAVSQKLDDLQFFWSGSSSFLEIIAPIADAESLANWLLNLAVSDNAVEWRNVS